MGALKARIIITSELFPGSIRHQSDSSWYSKIPLVRISLFGYLDIFPYYMASIPFSTYSYSVVRRVLFPTRTSRSRTFPHHVPAFGLRLRVMHGPPLPDPRWGFTARSCKSNSTVCGVHRGIAKEGFSDVRDPRERFKTLAISQQSQQTLESL